MKPDKSIVRRYVKELKDQRHENNTLRNRIKEFERQNAHFEMMMKMGRFGDELSNARLAEMFDEEAINSPRSILSSVRDAEMTTEGGGTEACGKTRPKVSSLANSRRMSPTTDAIISTSRIANIQDTGGSKSRGGKRVSISNILDVVASMVQPSLKPRNLESPATLLSGSDESDGEKQAVKELPRAAHASGGFKHRKLK